jgi:glycosyltransferase involved in cell wall biosynthesis
MSFKGILKRIASPIVRPLSRAIGAEMARSGVVEAGDRFQLDVVTAARGIAASGDQRVISPSDARQNQGRPLRVALGGNMGNFPYNAAKCLRRRGVEVDLLIEDSGFDTFIMARPFWEDVPVECSSYEEGAKSEYLWKRPEFVKQVGFDAELQARYNGRYSAIREVQGLYRETFGVPIGEDRAFVLAQFMGHWPYIAAAGRYDVVQLTAAALSVAPFLPNPTIAYPAGSDLFISPFEENLLGFLVRAAYRSVAHVIVAAVNYGEYLDRLGACPRRTYVPTMIDTDTNYPGDSPEIRQAWKKAIGGEKFILGVCRQSWQWKGSDRLIRAFDLFVKHGHDDWRLVLQDWGTDVAKSRHLIRELGVEAKVLWTSLCSKPVLRARQRAADLIADQFVMPGYGTSVLEAMAAGKSVLMVPLTEADRVYFEELPPFFGHSEPNVIAEILTSVVDSGGLEARNAASLLWLVNNHSPDAGIPKLLSVYEAAARCR